MKQPGEITVIDTTSILGKTLGSDIPLTQYLKRMDQKKTLWIEDPMWNGISHADRFIIPSSYSSIKIIDATSVIIKP